MINNKIKIPWYRYSPKLVGDLTTIATNDFPQIPDFRKPTIRPKPNPRFQEEPVRQPESVTAPKPIIELSPKPFELPNPFEVPTLNPLPLPSRNPNEKPFGNPLPSLNPLRQPLSNISFKTGKESWINNVISELQASEIVVDTERLSTYLMNYNYDEFTAPDMLEEMTGEFGMVVAYTVTTAVLIGMIGKEIGTAPARIYMMTPLNPNDINNDYRDES